MKNLTFSFLVRLTLVVAILFRGFSAMATNCPSAIVINQSQLPIVGQAVNCGSTNDINAATLAASAGGANTAYLGGNEALYEFTPTTTGFYSIDYTGLDYTSINLYRGCPTTAGSVFVSGVGTAATSKSIGAALTAGITYYFLFDTWPTPNSACPGVFSLSLVPLNTATASALGGLWSNPASWASGVVPNGASSVVVPAGSIITIDQAVSFIDLTISGILQYNATATNTLTVNGNMLINSEGKFFGYTPSPNTATLNLFGNFTNNGYANLMYTIINLNSLSGSTLDGSGVFQSAADGRGLIRAIAVFNGGNNTINTSQELTLTSGFNGMNGNLNTNGKIKFDNTGGTISGLPFNQQVQSVAVTAMGSGYTVAPVVFGAAVVQYASGLAALSGTRYIYGNNVYLATAAGTFNATPPESTGATLFTSSGPSLMWIGTNGNIGTNLPYNGTLSLTTQYFVGDNLYRATTATAVTITFPTHTSGVVGNLRYVGQAPKVSVNFNAATGNVRSLNLVNPGSGLITGIPAIVFSVGVAGGAGSGAAATAVYLPRVAGGAGFLVQKNGQGTVSGGLNINSDQGTSVATSHPQASSGVGNVSTTDGGNNYTVAPLVGFSGPTALNLVTNAGSGYISLPTVVLAGGTLVSGTALTSSNFIITTNQGKIVSVYLNPLATACYSVPPTLSFNVGNATLEFPAGCWPAATAIIGSNGALVDFNITNAGFGYVAAPTVGVGTTTATAAGGTFSVVAVAPIALIGTYAINTNLYGGYTVFTTQADDAFIPANRKMLSFSLLGNGSGLNLLNNLTLYGNAPLTIAASLASPGNIIDLGGYNLNCTWNGYAGISTPTYSVGGTGGYIKNGSMTLTGRGGGTTGSTFSFPFDMPLIVSTGAGATAVTTGSDILTCTASQLAVVSNATTGGDGLSHGSRSYKVENKTTLGATGISGTNAKVTMSYAGLDNLTTTQNGTVLVQSSSDQGPWTVVSAPYSATLSTALPASPGLYGAFGSLASSVVASPAPISLGATNYFAWGTQSPVVSSVLPLTACSFNDLITITGSGFAGVSAVSIGGTPVANFTVVSSTSITCYAAAGTTGVVSLTKLGSVVSGTQTVTINSGPASPILSTTAVSASFGAQVTVSVVGPVVGTSYNWYTTPFAGFAAVTDSIYTAPACNNVYVSAGNGACESERTAVIVSVTYPQIVSSEEVFCGVGGGLSLTAAPMASTASILWESLTAGVVLSSTSANPTSTTIVSTSDFRLTVSAVGCPDFTIVKSIGVYPLPSAVVTTSASGVCPGTSATINSGLSAGNFAVAAIPISMHPVPANAVTLVANGAAVVPQTSTSLDDGGWAALPIGFAFNYFGTSHTTINIGTNATVHLGAYNGASLTDFTFTTFPSLLEPASVIGAACHDMNFAASAGALNGTIKYWTKGYAPNRRFIVQYENARAYNTGGATAQYTTNQIHFLETVGTVEVHVLSSNATGYNKVVGLQDQSRTIGAVALATSAAITNLAWRFSPPSDFSTIWTANGSQIASGTNIFTQSVSPTSTTLYDISYANLTTGCASEPGSAQVNMLVLSSEPITGVSATSTVSSVCPGSTVPLAHSYTVSSSGLTFQWQSSVDGGTTWVDVVGATATTFSPIQNVETSYRVGISSCLGQISYSAPVAISMSSFVNCYCTPNTGTPYDEEILNVTLSTLNNSSTCTEVAPGLGSVAAVYGNYTGLPATNFYQGLPVSGSLTIGSCGTYNYNSGAAIFIDYNHNGLFTDAGEKVWSNGSTANIASVPASVVSASFTPSSTSLPGLTRMRIMNSEFNAGDNILPCVSPNYGEVEDYLVNIVSPPDAPATPVATNSGNCIAGDTITMVGTAPAGVTYYWQTTASGTSLSNSASTLVVNTNGTYYIRAYASMGGQWSTAASITLSGFPIVTPPTAITNLSGTPYCNAVILQADSAPAGISYYWQGTNSLGSVNSSAATTNFTASASGIYYVAARNDSTACWSVTTSINVVVYPAPTGTTTPLSAASCSSTEGSVLFNVASAYALEYSLTDTTWSTSNSIAALPGTYNASVRYLGVGGCVVPLGPVTVGAFSMNQVSISRADSLACSIDLMTVVGSVTGQAAGLTYQWQSSIDGGVIWSDIAGANSLNLSQTQQVATQYRLGVSYCAGAYAYTSSVGIAMENVQNCYCIPTYTAGTSAGDLISLVSIVGTTLNNNTGFVNGTPNYTLYNTLPNHTATLMPSSTYTLNVATGAWGSQGMAAWIDYNDDGIFALSERIGATPGQIGVGFTAGQINATGSFTISLACAPPAGLHRMRVRTVYLSNGVNVSPCLTYTYGETEDYMVTIATPPACPSPGLFAANLSTAPTSTSADFVWEQGCAASTYYDFEYGPVGFALGTGTLVLNQAVSVSGTTASYTLTGIASASTYDVYARVHCDSVNASSWSTAISIVTAPSAPTTAAQTFCQGATVANLVATGTAASTCNYTFIMSDAWGDGWNGAQMKVMNGTTVVATLNGPANANGGGSPLPNSLAQTVLLQSGISYSLVWNTSGLYDEEVGVNVLNPSAVSVYSMAYNSQALAGTTIATIAANCPASAPIYWYSSATSNAWLSTTTVLSSGTYYASQVVNGYESSDRAATEITIIPNTSVTTPVTATYSYTWNNVTYTASGTYTGTTTNCVTQMLALTIVQPTVTFQVDMAQSNAPAGAIPYVNGAYNGWCGNCNPMTNIGGTVWALTVPLPANASYEYKFTYNGWDGQENLLAGSSCTVTSWGYTNRIFAHGTTDVVLPLVCWNSCSACGPQSAVTFKVDMTQYNLAPGLVPEVNGTFNGWCGNCNPMSDANGDGVWETTVVIPDGSYEYKFSISNWAQQESLTPGSSCTVTTGQYTNRTLSLTAGSALIPYAAVVLPTVCWNSCSACSANLALNVFLDGYYVNLSSPAVMRAARYVNLVESGSLTPGAATDVDVITVELRSAANLDVVAYSASPKLQTNGTVQCVFPPAAAGNSYYVVVNHRASNPLWSAAPVAITTTSTFSFANNSASAHTDGDPSITPMHTIASGLYSIWLGELNDDGYLDSQDYSAYETDINASGYLGLYLLDGDLNGDAYVDASDYAVFDYNSNQGTYMQRPY